MCGIGGIYNFPSSNANITVAAKKMLNALQHRGPDNNGFWQSQNVALVHSRLSIIDLSEAGNQPFVSNCGRYILVFNGEIYNYRELKTKLTQYQFKSETDTEVVLAAYIQWREKCLDHFNGMFAFAMFDKSENKLFIARDRLGIKPLYYILTDNYFAFASEIRALLKSKLFAPKLNHAQLSDYFRYQTILSPETIIENVNMLPPAHYGILSGEKFNLFKYYSLQKQIFSVKEISLTESRNKIASLLRESVKMRMNADVDFGVFLSGGIDSTIIAGLMSENNATKVNTFTVTFDEQEYSEAYYAQRVAERFNTNHTEIRLAPNDFLNELPNALNAMDFPGGDGQNSYIISKVVRAKGIKMALSGLGGDELFAGYPVFAHNSMLKKYLAAQHIPLFVRKLAGKLITTLKPSSAAAKINHLLNLKHWNFNEVYSISRQLFAENELKQLIPVIYSTENAVKKAGNQLNWNNPIQATSLAEIQTYLQNILLRDTDFMSMAHGLELRVPFLDHHLVDFVLSLPDEYKYQHSPKQLLTSTFAHLLTEDQTNRKKMGFTLPWQHWMQNELHDFCHHHIESLANRHWTNPYQIHQLWNNYKNNHPTTQWSKLWHLVVLDYWLEENVGS